MKCVDVLSGLKGRDSIVLKVFTLEVDIYVL